MDEQIFGVVMQTVCKDGLQGRFARTVSTAICSSSFFVDFLLIAVFFYFCSSQVVLLLIAVVVAHHSLS